MSRRFMFLVSVLALFGCTPHVLVFGQEYRATLLGIVTDSSGAVVPNATVIVANIETGVSTSIKTGAEGGYQAPFLIPGKYSLRVEAAGFKSFSRSPIELRVNDRTRMDVVLDVGDIADKITVVAETPLLEVASSNRGQLIEARKLSDLPLNTRNPFTLMNLSTGVQYTGSMQYFRPFDNGDIANFSINGGRNGMNAFQIDGVPDDANNNRGDIAYVPPSEATQEFKIQTNTYDSQYGRTGGGVISLSIKPGTNSFHGAVYEYLRRPWLEANTYANNANRQKKVQRSMNQYGFEIDGPVTIPKVFSGRDRTFFMFSFEKYVEHLPQPVQGTVPTKEQRAGDFSQTLMTNGRPYTIYDPLTIRANPDYVSSRPVTLTNLQYLRAPFSGNRIPSNRIEPIAQRVLQDIPLPNQDGEPVTRVNNWFAGNAATDNDYKSLILRIDHNMSSAWRLYGRWHHSYRDGTRTDYWDWNTPATRAIFGFRRNDGAAIDLTGTPNPSTSLNFRVGLTRYNTGSHYIPQDISGLGFPAGLSSQLQTSNKYPTITFENYMQTGNTEWSDQPNEAWSLQASLLKILGGHSLKAGTEFRLLHFATTSYGNASGTYGFTRSWTNSNPQVTDPAAGDAMASFLLGYLASGSATINASPYISWRYPVVYLQDDWQVTRKLTLNLGLRWDYESPPVERFNRLTRGFDLQAKSPYQVPGFDLRGGLLFAGVNGQPRPAFDSDRNNWQPRAGLAYKLFQKRPLVFRAGAGRYYLPTIEWGEAVGFTRSTSVQTSTASFLPFQVLSNPFPNGLIQPPGSSEGMKTQVGDGVSFSDPTRGIPGMWQYSAGFQYEIIPGLLAEATYVGSRTTELQVSKSISYLTVEQLAMGTSYLNQAVANPFYGVLPASTSRGAQATTQRRNLMTQYPHFTGVTMNNQSLGESWYNSVQLRLEQRFKHGLSFLVSYTASKTMEAMSYLNAQDTGLARELVAFDVPQRLVFTGIYEFPVGPKRRWANSGIVSHIVGDWQFSWSNVIQSGTPMSYPDYYIYGNPKLSSGQSMDRWFDTSPSIWVQRPADTLRVTPLRSPNIRRHTAPQLDGTLIRNFRLHEGHTLQFKVSAFNLTNTPIFNFPTTSPTSSLFGVVPVTQLNLPRSVELGFRYAF